MAAVWTDCGWGGYCLNSLHSVHICHMYGIQCVKWYTDWSGIIYNHLLLPSRKNPYPVCKSPVSNQLAVQSYWPLTVSRRPLEADVLSSWWSSYCVLLKSLLSFEIFHCLTLFSHTQWPVVSCYWCVCIDLACEHIVYSLWLMRLCLASVQTHFQQTTYQANHKGLPNIGRVRCNDRPIQIWKVTCHTFCCSHWF